MVSVTIRGAAGILEGEFEGDDSSQSGVVLCHPHPLYGGSMQDRIVAVLADAFRQSGFATLRFNFRGVGNSEGEYDGGMGEVSDVSNALAWMSESVSEVSLAGYSFGAITALRASVASQVKNLVLVAPPVAMLREEESVGAGGLIMLGELDTIVDAVAAEQCFSDHKVIVVEGADHFFMGADSVLGDAVRAHLALS